MLRLSRRDLFTFLLCCALALLAGPSEVLEAKAKGEPAKEEADEHLKELVPSPEARATRRARPNACASAGATHAKSRDLPRTRASSRVFSPEIGCRNGIGAHLRC